MPNFERYTACVLLLILTVILAVQIAARYIFFTSIAWIEESSRIIFVWFLYLSISWIILQGRHIRINAVDLLLSAPIKRLLSLVADFLWLAFNILMTYYSLLFVISEIEIYSETAILRIPNALVHAILPFGFGLMTIRLAQYMVRFYVKGGPEVIFLSEKLEEEQ